MTDARGQAEQTDAGTGDVEALCVLFHDAYEAAAAGAGWETQERSRKPWADVPEANKETMRATIRAILASDWLAAHTATAEARGAERGARGVRFRVEVACDGYAHLMDEDVPSNESDLAAYQQGAHDAAEAIRAVLIEGGA